MRSIATVPLLLILSLTTSLSLGTPSPQVGEEVPWFAGWTVAGKILNKKMILKKPQKNHLLILTASWCSTCKKCLKELSKNRKVLQKNAIAVYPVAYLEDAEVATDYLVRKYRYGRSAIILDEFGKITESMGVTKSTKNSQSVSLPLSIMFDSRGKIRFKSSECRKDYFSTLLEAARAPPAGKRKNTSK